MKKDYEKSDLRADQKTIDKGLSVREAFKKLEATVFKSKKEILQALIDGKKITHYQWGADNFVALIDDELYYEGGMPTSLAQLDLSIPGQWRIFTEKEKPRTVHAYINHLGEVRYVIKNSPEEKTLKSIADWTHCPGLTQKETL